MQVSWEGGPALGSKNIKSAKRRPIMATATNYSSFGQADKETKNKAHAEGRQGNGKPASGTHHRKRFPADDLTQTEGD